MQSIMIDDAASEEEILPVPEDRGPVRDAAPPMTGRVRRVGMVVWTLIVIAAAAIVTLLRVPVSLGVQVTCPVGPYFGRGETACRKVRSELLWRVWWDSRSSFVHVRPQWVLTAGIGIGLALIVGATFAVLWLILAGDDRENEFAAGSRPPPAALEQ